MNVDTGLSFVRLLSFHLLIGMIDTQWAYLVGIRVRNTYPPAGPLVVIKSTI